MKNRHAWTERDPEGGRREIEARKEAGRWRLRSHTKEDPVWRSADEPLPRAWLEALRDLLWRKYQRRRASWEDVQLADRMLGELPPPES